MEKPPFQFGLKAMFVVMAGAAFPLTGLISFQLPSCSGRYRLLLFVRYSVGTGGTNGSPFVPAGRMAEAPRGPIENRMQPDPAILPIPEGTNWHLSNTIKTQNSSASQTPRRPMLADLAA